MIIDVDAKHETGDREERADALPPQEHVGSAVFMLRQGERGAVYQHDAEPEHQQERAEKRPVHAPLFCVHPEILSALRCATICLKMRPRSS
jgi:hypothetical protein